MYKKTPSAENESIWLQLTRKQKLEANKSMVLLTLKSTWKRLKE